MAHILSVAFECFVVCVGVALLGCCLCWARLAVDTPVGLAWGQALGVRTSKAAGCVSTLNEQKNGATSSNLTTASCCDNMEM